MFTRLHNKSIFYVHRYRIYTVKTIGGEEFEVEYDALQLDRDIIISRENEKIFTKHITSYHKSSYFYGAIKETKSNKIVAKGEMRCSVFDKGDLEDWYLHKHKVKKWLDNERCIYVDVYTEPKIDEIGVVV